MEPVTMRSPRRRSRLFDNERFRFTPLAVSKKAARLWDRKPTTPICPRSKPQKIWKRYLDSTSSETGIMRDTGSFCTEINPAATLGALRGVKRMRVAHRKRGRSFLETKWETETGERRRKNVAPAEKDGVVDSVGGTTTTTAAILTTITTTSASFEYDDTELLGDALCSSPFGNPSEISQPEDSSSSEETGSEAVTPPEMGTMNDRANQEMMGTPMSTPKSRRHTREVFQDVVAEPAAAGLDKGLVGRSPPRGMLRNTSLDREDAALISDFLSQARAKRAAIVTPIKGTDAVIVDRVSESPTSSPRRALEAVDSNSPRSQRRHTSPAKIQPPNFYFSRQSTHRGPSSSTEAVEKENKAQFAPVPEIHYEPKGHAPKIPDQIPMRRRKGNEFIFMQRTDDQQTALLTKANTRLNKGTKPPHKLLPILNQAIAALDKHQEAEQPLPLSPQAQLKKQVKWNDDALIEFCGEKVPEFDAVVYQNAQALDRCLRSSARRNTSKSQPQTDGADGNYKPENSSPFHVPVLLPAPATPYRSTPVPRKMRKLVGAKHLDVHPNEGESPPVARINFAMKTSTAFPTTPLRHKKSFALGQVVPRTLAMKPAKTATSTSAPGSGYGLGSGIGYPAVLQGKQTKS